MAFGDLINRQTSQSTRGNAMNAPKILTKSLSLVTPNMHAHRRNAVSACLISLMQGASATVTSIGRGIRSKALEKHNIKRADRLLSNPKLSDERDLIYAAISQLWVSASATPVIHVDWSDLDDQKQHFLLRAAMAFDGRSLTLYEEVHDITSKEKRATHKAFLTTLKAILPASATPILVTDAGFKTPWFKQVLALGWHYVGRARKPNAYQAESTSWQCISHLYPKATVTPKGFEGSLCKSRPLPTYFVLVKDTPKGRHKYNRSGVPSRAGNSLKCARRSKDPWLLVTSLPIRHGLAKRVTKIYRMRMQIEEGFRDMKSPRSGQGYSHNLSRNIARVRNLVLLTTLTAMVAILIGWTVRFTGQHKQYQANTTLHRKVLSYHYLGMRAYVDKRIRLTKRAWIETIHALKAILAETNDVSV